MKRIKIIAAALSVLMVVSTVFSMTVFAECNHDWVLVDSVEPTCEEDGKDVYRCSVCGDIREETAGAYGHMYTSHTTPATPSADGVIMTECMVCGDVEGRRTIPRPYKFTLSKIKYVYDGKAKKPSIVITNKDKETFDKRVYNLTYKNNTKIGTATAIVTFKGNNYAGTKKISFKIVPKKTSLTSLTAGVKSFKAKWKKISGITGYQIYYSTSSKFTSATTKSVRVKSATATSKTVKKLKSKKTYYVKIRTYKTVKEKNYYSDWSKVLKVKTK